MTDLSTEDRIRRLQERRSAGATGRGSNGRPKRTVPAKASRVAVFGASTTIMLGMMTGMAWNAGLQTVAAPPAAPPTESSSTLMASPPQSPVLEQTRSRVAAVPAPTTVTPIRQTLSITRSGGSR